MDRTAGSRFGPLATPVVRRRSSQSLAHSTRYARWKLSTKEWPQSSALAVAHTALHYGALRGTTGAYPERCPRQVAEACYPTIPPEEHVCHLFRAAVSVATLSLSCRVGFLPARAPEV